MKALDKTDFELIRICKSNDEVKLDTLKPWYSKAYAMDEEYFCIQPICELMVEILFFCGRWKPFTLLEFLQDLHPNKDGWFGEKPRQDDLHWSRIFSRLCSMIRLTSVDNIPGYREWREEKQVAITLENPRGVITVIHRTNTLEEAVTFLNEDASIDMAMLHEGCYGIDAPEEMINP